MWSKLAKRSDSRQAGKSVEKDETGFEVGVDSSGETNLGYPRAPKQGGECTSRHRFLAGTPQMLTVETRIADYVYSV